MTKNCDWASRSNSTSWCSKSRIWRVSVSFGFQGFCPNHISSEPFSYPNQSPSFAAEKEERTAQHAAELQKKDNEIAELKRSLAEAEKDLQALGKVEKDLRDLKGTHSRTKKSLECTANSLKELQDGGRRVEEIPRRHGCRAI